MSKPPSPLEIAWMKAHAADTRVPDMIAATVICSVASTAFVVLRFISRRMACIKPRLNDWLLVVSLVCGFSKKTVGCVPPTFHPTTRPKK